ncbi:hypothetical protein Hanom_Chr09g00852191 [Helianthus anomalus]
MYTEIDGISHIRTTVIIANRFCGQDTVRVYNFVFVLFFSFGNQCSFLFKRRGDCFFFLLGTVVEGGGGGWNWMTER